MLNIKKISRRRILTTGAATAVVLTLKTPVLLSAVSYKDQKITVIDSHHHFWKIRTDKLSDEMKAAPPLEQPYLPGYFKKYLDSTGVDYTILIQGFEQSPEGNRQLFHLAQQAGFVAGVVAWTDLSNPAELDKHLDILKKEPRFAGIRNLVPMEKDDKWLIRPDVIESLHILAKRNIPYDLILRPKHYPAAIKLLNKVSGLNMVIDHMGQPDIVNGNPIIWQDFIKEMASGPNVYCKLSGMVSNADMKNWKYEDLQPYFDHSVKCFGFKRLMFGSDWPVCLDTTSYKCWLDTVNQMVAGIQKDDYVRFFGGNAIDFYKLKLPSKTRQIIQ